MASDSEESSAYDNFEELNEGQAAEYEFKQTLFDRIKEIQATGSYATGNVLESAPVPAICVDGCEPIAIPLSKEAAEDLARKSEKAPFGMRGQTLIDETVRNTLEIGAERISFKNPQWHTFVNTLVQRVAEELGVPPAPDGPTVHAELYKHLLYPPGAMFKPHKDTEKDPHMFATLIICLPSEHTGGTVCLQHGDASVDLPTADTSAFNYYYLAWYTDVTHEIKPVETGYRWVLAYNLIMGDRTSCLSASALDAQTENLVQALSSWEKLEYTPEFYLYPLDHQYTPRNMRLSSLKGLDYQRARCLSDSCDRHDGFVLLLARHNKYESWANDEGGDENMIRRTYLDNVRSLEGFVLSNEWVGVHKSYKGVDVHKSTLLVPIHYHDRNPDSRAGGEYCGNQHAEIEEQYEDVVLVIVRKISIDVVLFNAERSQLDAIKVMRHLLSLINDDTRATLQKILVRLCRIILDEKIAVAEKNDVYLGYVASIGASLRDWPLFKEAQKKTRRTWNLETWFTLGGLIDIQDGLIDANEQYRCMVKCEKLRLAYKSLTRFYNGFCSSNVGREDPAKAKYWKQWYSDKLVKTLDGSWNCTGTDEAVTIKDISLDLDVKYTSAQQKKIDQAVINLVHRFKDNKTFVNALTVELLLVLSKPDCARTDFLGRVFDVILEAAISTFDLQDHYEYAHSVLQDMSYSDTLIRDFYHRALANSEESAFDLLRQFSSQAFKAKECTVLEILLPVMKQLLPSVDTGSPEVRTCLQSLVEAYITQTVGNEPPKPEPEDWARPEEVNECYSGCKRCPKLNAFVKDPKAPEKTIPMSEDDQRHVTYCFKHLTVEKGEREGEVRLTKTLRGWEERHKNWESKGKRAQEQLQDMPNDLKEALGDKYDTLMTLDLIRIDRVTAKQGEASDQTQSSTSLKRSHGKDAQDTVPQKTSKRTRRGR